jgi:hypothetical protein
MLKILIATFVGAILGSLLTHWFALMREGKERKRKFRAVVELVRFEIEAAPKDKIWDVHRNSVRPLQEQAAHVLLDIRAGQLEAFRANSIRYSKLTSEDLPNFINADPNTSNPQYEAAIVAITDPLANLIELADGQKRDAWLASKANKAARTAASRK